MFGSSPSPKIVASPLVSKLNGEFTECELNEFNSGTPKLSRNTNSLNPPAKRGPTFKGRLKFLARVGFCAGDGFLDPVALNRLPPTLDVFQTPRT
jgi:hypothetical protein